MLFRNWYAPGRPRSGIRGRAQFRPWLEALEDRTLPSLQAVSVTSLPPDSGAAASDSPSISADGRYVAFASDAPNLVPGDTNNARDVFVRDLLTGKTTLVSVNSAGTASGNGSSDRPVITPDGRYVAFTSFATDLVANDVNPGGDVFVRDLLTGTTTLVSVTYSGDPATGSSGAPVITPDGRYVAFQSDAGNLTPIPNDNGQENIYVRDLVAGTTSLVSINSGGTATGDSGSFEATISADGRYVAFASGADDLTAGDTNPSSDIYQRDSLTGTTVLISKHYSGTGDSGPSADPVMSADGRFVAFDSFAGDLTPTGPNGPHDVWIWDRSSGVTSLVSVNNAGTAGGNSNSNSPAISADGSKVAFVSLATDIGSGGTNGVFNVYVRDVSSGTTTLANAPQTGPSDGFTSYNPVLSADGQLVAFLSNATNLVASATSGNYNVYVRNLSSGVISLASVNQAGTGDGANSSFSPVISGDGTAVAFASYAENLVANDTNNASDVFLRNLTAGTTALVSRRDPGLPSVTGSGLSDSPSVSADGRYVAFRSDAPDLVPGDTNGTSDIFVRDLLMGTTTLVSVNQAGTASGNGPSFSPSISADGRYVAFTSLASDLVANDTNNTADVFVRDLLTGTTRLVSVNQAGTDSGNNFSFNAVISADGSHVAFESFATDLTANAVFGVGDLFNRDLSAGTTTLVSVSQTGTGGDFESFNPVLSEDGRTVAFVSHADNLVGNDQNGTIADVYVRSIDKGTTLVSVNSAGTSGNGDSFFPAISADGKVIAFESFANNLVANDTNNSSDIFAFDLKARTTTLVSVNQAGTDSGDGPSEGPSISANGRYVAFSSFADDLAANDTNGTSDVFVRDLKARTTTLVSVNQAGTASGNGTSFFPVISADGQAVAFISYASDLAGADTNNNADVYVRNLKQGTTALASHNAAGTDSGNSFSFAPPVISADDSTVVFASYASDLVLGDYNNNQDVFAFT